MPNAQTGPQLHGLGRARVARLHLHHCRVFHFRLPIGSCCHGANCLDSRKKRFFSFFFSLASPRDPLTSLPVSCLLYPVSTARPPLLAEDPHSSVALSVTPPPPQVSAALLSGHRAPERTTPTSCTLQLQSDNPPRRRGWCEQQRTRSRVNWAPRRNQRVSGLADAPLGRCKLQTNAARGLHSSHDTDSCLDVVRPALVCTSAPQSSLDRHPTEPTPSTPPPATSCFFLLRPAAPRASLRQREPPAAPRSLLTRPPPPAPALLSSDRETERRGVWLVRFVWFFWPPSTASSTRRTNCSNSPLFPLPSTSVDALPPPLCCSTPVPFLRAL